MRRHPTPRRVFHAAKREHDHRALEPLRHFRTFMREQSVIAQRDRLTEDEHAEHHDDQTSPGEEVGEAREERGGVQQRDWNRVEPVDLPTHDAVRQGKTGAIAGKRCGQVDGEIRERDARCVKKWSRCRRGGDGESVTR